MPDQEPKRLTPEQVSSMLGAPAQQQQENEPPIPEEFQQARETVRSMIGNNPFLPGMQAAPNFMLDFALGVARTFSAGASDIAIDTFGRAALDEEQQRMMQYALSAQAPVEKIASRAGEFIGFIGGAPMKLGKGALTTIGKTKAGKEFFEWFGSKVGDRAVNWLKEGLALGVASGVASHEGTMELLRDPSISNVAQDFTNRLSGMGMGMFQGARYGFVRDKLGTMALRAAANIAITQGVLYAQTGEAPPMEDIVFDVLMDVWFSKYGRPPMKTEAQRIKEATLGFMEGVKKENIDPGKVIYDVVSKTERGPKPPSEEPILDGKGMEGVPGKGKDFANNMTKLASRIAKRQQEINRLRAADNVKDVEKGSRLLEEQLSDLYALNALTRTKWEYNPKTKSFEAKGRVSAEEKTRIFEPDPEAVPTLVEDSRRFNTNANRDNDIIRLTSNALFYNIEHHPNVEKISNFADLFFGPEFALRKYPEASKLSAKIIEAEELINFQTKHIDYSYFQTTLRKLDGLLQGTTRGHQRKLVRGAIEKTYELESGKRELATLSLEKELTPEQAARKKSLEEAIPLLEAQLAKNPGVKEAATDVIKWFKTVREEIKEHKRKMVRLKSDPSVSQALDEFIANAYETSPEGYLTHKPKEARNNTLSGLKSKYGLDDVQFKALKQSAKDYLQVDFWGVRDYITKIETGTYKILDETGTVRAIKPTRAEAEMEAKLLIDIGDIQSAKIVNEYSKLDPTQRRKGILRGEEDIFTALSRYSYAVRKRLVLEPLIIELESSMKNNPDAYTPNMRKVLKRQLEALKGGYSPEDAFVDFIFEKFGSGGKPLRATRSVNFIRAREAESKLGYRPVAAFVNLTFGNAHVIAKTGLGYWTRAFKFLKTPEGEKFWKQEEPYMGMAFADYEASTALRTISKLHPMWLFSVPEKQIRRTALAANYLFAKEKLRMSENEAREYAQRGVRAQAFVYNTTAMPTWMRGPTGKLLGQFKSYMVQEMQFLATLSGKEWARYIGMMVALGGPETVIHVLQSLPILNSLGALDKLEEYIIKEVNVPGLGNIRPGYGLPGLLNIDISPSAALQLPTRFEQWAGPFVADVMKLWQHLVGVMKFGAKDHFRVREFEEGGPAVKAQVVTEKMADFVVQMNYINDLLSTYYEIPGPDGRVWVRSRSDKGGKLLYPLESNWDYVKLAIGAKPEQKSVYQTKLRLDAARKRKNLEQYRGKIIRAVDVYNKTGRLPKDFIDEALQMGMTDAGALTRMITNTNLTPEQRVLQATKLIEQQDTQNLFYEELYRNAPEE